jgi:hypothetical protein
MVTGDSRALVRGWAGALSDPASWAGVYEQLASLGDSPASTGALGDELGRLVGLAEAVEAQGPPPIGLALGRSVLPEDPYDPQWPFIRDWIPVMRADVEEATGVPVPGIRAREHEVDDEFVIELNGVAVEAWRLEPGLGFLPLTPSEAIERGVPPNAVRPLADPVDHSVRSLVRRDAVPSGAGLDPDPLHLVLRCVNDVLRRNVPRMLSMDLVADLLEDNATPVADDGELHAITQDLVAWLSRGERVTATWLTAAAQTADGAATASAVAHPERAAAATAQPHGGPPE